MLQKTHDENHNYVTVCMYRGNTATHGISHLNNDKANKCENSGTGHEGLGGGVTAVTSPILNSK